MKQLVIISGKGGTGKTVLTGAFAALAESKVMVDCDVDAPDLHLLLQPDIKERYVFHSSITANINKNKCIECGKCRTLCRFDAITENFIVNPISCEGCAFCSYVCPAKAIEMKENTTGEWYISETRFGALVHAKLGIAEENSGKLVALVRNKAKEIAEKRNYHWVIIDGSPGIGCPVIASITGTDCAIVVTEPTLSGLHDADRVIKVAKHFNVPVRLIVNKYDLNNKMTEEIEDYCRQNALPLIGKIVFDEAVIKAMVEGKTIVEYRDSSAKRIISALWNSIQEEL